MGVGTILVINANTSISMTKGIEASAQKVASRGTKIITVSSKRGPRTIEGPVDQAFSIPGMLEIAKELEGQFHGIISACFGDPGLEALKLAFGVPVIGIRESSFLLASLIGNNFSIITPVSGTERKLRNFAREKGMEDKLLSVEYAGVTVSDLETGLPRIEEFIYKSAREAIKKGADVLIFGCAGMGKIVDKVSSRLDVPCIDPIGSAIKIMEGILHFCSDKRSKGVPLKKEMIGYPDWSL